jgi:hypothetical protein
MRLSILGFIALAILCGLSPLADKPSVSRLAPQSIEWRDLMDFMSINAWKTRLTSDSPFNTIRVSLGWYERQDNGRFVRQPIGDRLDAAMLQKTNEQVIAVLWRAEGSIVRFQVNCHGQAPLNCTAPAQRLIDYTAVGDGTSGMLVEGNHVLAVKWKKDAPAHAPEKKYMDGYIAVEIELGLLKGLND